MTPAKARLYPQRTGRKCLNKPNKGRIWRVRIYLWVNSTSDSTRHAAPFVTRTPFEGP